ncbi:hypothetical protein [Dehalogenimonas alkenigignens]|uniref:hypothetical protein n=1 Tax=Dehalogenimonas alkenigignens TaxID=1217799 RepID=UPI000D5800CE|nr:hypothetical protein [Dehalogenimonas alkenigignens]PVV83514.1 hypothetical protein DD509_06705 [Dehalogenimonas alkenigignens]
MNKKALPQLSGITIERAGAARPSAGKSLFRRDLPANAVVIDKLLGAAPERLDDSVMDKSWRKYLYDGRWMPVVIRRYAADGSVSYSEPALPAEMQTPPEKLWRALTAIGPVCKRLFPSGGAWLKGLKIAVMIGFLVALSVALILIGSEMVKPA